MIKASLKSLLSRKVRLMMSTFAIVLGVAFVAGTLIFTDTLSRSFTALFASTVGDVVVEPDGASEYDTNSTATLPASLVDTLADAEGAARADGNVSASGVYVIGDDGKVVGGFGPPALAGNWTDAPTPGGDGLQVVEGEEPSGKNEVVLDEFTVEQSGYQVGDTVPLLLPAGDAKINPTLVGISGFPDGGSLNGASMATFDTKTAQDLFLEGKNVFNNIWVTADDGVSESELQAEVEPLLPDQVKAVTGDEAAEDASSGLLEGIGFISTFLLIFAGIALVVGAFLIVNTFSILLAQRSRELALLRALGASRRQVMWSVQLEALLVGAFGAIAGLLLGVALAFGLRALFGRIGMDISSQEMIFEPRTIVVSLIVGIGVTMVAAWSPARQTTRIAPVQALRDDVALPESSVHRRFLLGVAAIVLGAAAILFGLFVEPPQHLIYVGAGALVVLIGTTAASPVLSRPLLAGARTVYAKLFGTVGNLAGQNTLRNPRRTTATASALMIGLTLASMMAILGASAKASVDQVVEENFVGDYVVSNAVGGEFNPEIAKEMAAVDGVESVVAERFQVMDGPDGSQGVGAIAPADADFFQLDLESGSLDDFADGSVLVSQDYAETLDVSVGDTVTFEGPAGKQKWKVAGVFAENPVLLFPIVTTPESLTKAGFEPADNALFITADPDATGLEERLKEVVADLPIVTVKDEAGFAAEQREPIDQFVLIIFALLGLALVIAVLGIVNTLALSVIERTREVGLLRAVGMGRRQLRRMITLESVVIAVLGTVLGLVLGVLFGIALMYGLRDEGLEALAIPYGQLALFLGLAVIVGVLAAILPARRAARLDVLKAIATE